jgi:uncharacterized protein (DUF427 family)
MMYIYRNSFHGTTAKSRCAPKDFETYYAGTRGGSWKKDAAWERAAKRLRDELCGIQDCQCSGWLGVRD